MKPVVAVIHGSPRKNSNSDALAEAFLKPLRALGCEIGEVRAGQVDIHPCIGCDACGKTGNCIFRDGMLSVEELLNRADWVVLVSPVYFNSLPGPLKTLIDRCQVYYARRFVLKLPTGSDTRKGFLLLSAGIAQTHDTLCGSWRVADYFYKAQNIGFEGTLCLDRTDACDTNHRDSVLSQATQWAQKMLDEFCV